MTKIYRSHDGIIKGGQENFNGFLVLSSSFLGQLLCLVKGIQQLFRGEGDVARLRLDSIKLPGARRQLQAARAQIQQGKTDECAKILIEIAVMIVTPMTAD
jgi:hypothetical protein